MNGDGDGDGREAHRRMPQGRISGVWNMQAVMWPALLAVGSRLTRLFVSQSDIQ